MREFDAGRGSNATMDDANPYSREATPMISELARRALRIVGFVLSAALPFSGAAAEQIPFSPAQLIPAGPRPADLVIDDFNADGRADFAVTNGGVEQSEMGVSVLLNLGNALFAPPIRSLAGIATRSIDAGDLDGDGDIDLAVGLMTEPSLLAVLKNAGDGTFGAPLLTGASDFRPDDCCARDLDNDGDLDVVLGLTFQGVAAVCKNSGDGTLPVADLYTSENFAYTSDLTVADLDGDQDLDFATVRTLTSDLPSILRNRGDATFDPLEPFSFETFEQFALDAGDVDRDGDQDLVLVGVGNRINVFLNDGSGALAFSNWYPLGSFTSLGARILLADLDADGAPEAIFPEVNGISVLVLRNNGAGAFAAPDEYSAGGAPGTTVAADLDGDGDSELVLARTISNQIAIFWNQLSTTTHTPPAGSGAGAQPILSAWPNPARHESIISYHLAQAGAVRLTLHDASGRLVRVLVARNESAGSHQVTWSGRSDAGDLVASGRYILALQGRSAGTMPLILLR